MQIPDRVRSRPPTARGAGWRAWYVPANTRRDLPAGSRFRAMDDFLLSRQLHKPVLEAAEDVASEARALAIEGGMVDSGDFVSSFDVEAGPVLTVSDPFPNPRVTGRVTNDSDHAAAVEWGNAQTKGQGHRVLGRAGEKFHTPKGAPE